MNIFINEAITNGLNAYIAKKDNKDFSLSHIFEYNIIEFLITLYGSIDILNTYQIKDEGSFRNSLKLYGASDEDVNKFIKLMNDYNVWLNSSTSNEKNTIIKDIFYILSKFVILKSKYKEIPLEEMNYYNNFLKLGNNKIKQIVIMSAESLDEVLNVYEKAVLDMETEAKEAEPILLSDEMYEDHGLDPDDVKSLSKTQIIDINNRIETDEETGGTNGQRQSKSLVLTSGSGFIDALVLLSIICTEIMIGVVITILLARL